MKEIDESTNSNEVLKQKTQKYEIASQRMRLQIQ